MNLLVWNYCELENPHTKRELIEIVQAKSPSVVFISETWADDARLDQNFSTINFDNR